MGDVRARSATIGTGVPLGQQHDLLGVPAGGRRDVAGLAGADCHDPRCLPHDRGGAPAERGRRRPCRDRAQARRLSGDRDAGRVHARGCYWASASRITSARCSRTSSWRPRSTLCSATLDRQQWAPDIANWTTKGRAGRHLRRQRVQRCPRHRHQPVRLRSNGLSVLRYWSNKDKQCTPIGVVASTTTTTTPQARRRRRRLRPPPRRRRRRRPVASPPLAGAWSHVGTGGKAGVPSLDGAVYALNADDPGVLFAGGSFTSAGGNPKAAHLARWNGSAWSAVGPTLNGDVHAIAYKAGKVFVGGVFTNAGGDQNLDFVAQWNGVKWGPVCNSQGPLITANVNALQIIGSTLYIGGSFANGAGIASADFILACNLTHRRRELDRPQGRRLRRWDLCPDRRQPRHALRRRRVQQRVRDRCRRQHRRVLGRLVARARLGAEPGRRPDRRLRAQPHPSATNLYVGTDSKNVGGVAQADHVARWNGSAWSSIGATRTAGTAGSRPRPSSTR